MTGERVAITGSRGFLGRALSTLLTQHGHTVVPLPSRREDGSRADLRKDDLDHALDGVTTIVHLAARAGGARYQRQGAVNQLVENADMTRRLLEAAHRKSVGRVVLASSASVYSVADHDLTEDEQLVRPDAPTTTGYAWSKLTCEAIASLATRSGETELTIARLANVYGPGGGADPDRHTIIHVIIDQAVRASRGASIEIQANPWATRNYVYLSDAVAALARMADLKTAPDTYNVGGSAAVSLGDIAATISEICEVNIVLAGSPRRDRQVLACDRLLGTGWSTKVDPRDGLRQTIDYFAALV